MPRTERTISYLPPEEKSAVLAAAVREGRTESSWVRRTLVAAIDPVPQEPNQDRQTIAEERRRTAKSNSSGGPCPNAAIKGGNVCTAHGGRAPQVRAAAQARILAMVEPALDTMLTAIKDDDPKVRATAAAKDILDRAGLAANTKVDVTQEVTSQDDFAAYLLGAREAFEARKTEESK